MKAGGARNSGVLDSLFAMFSYTKESLFPHQTYESFSSKIHHIGLYFNV
jgi:hypothetical protein